MAKQNIEAILPLSPLQEGMLFHALDGASEDPYFIQSGFVLEGNLNTAIFERAWGLLAARHAALRTSFVWQKVDKPVQVVRANAALPLSIHDLRSEPPEAREARVAALLTADRSLGFDLLKAPLMRLTLMQMTDARWYFINSHHHLLLDGWSFALLLREALIVYRALRAEQPPQLAPVRSYRDYLAWVGRRDTAAAEQHFRSTLAGFTAPTPLPTASRPGTPESDTFPCAEQDFRFSAAETEALAHAARHHRVTLNTLTQAAFGVVLRRHSGEREVLFGATVAGRPAELADSDSIVGVLINTLPVRVKVQSDAALGPWLRSLQEQNSRLRQHEWTPLSQVQRWSEVPSGQPLFQSIVVFDSYPEREAEDDELSVAVLPARSQHTADALLTAARNNYPLSLIVEPTAALRLVLCYARDHFEHLAAKRLLDQLRCLMLAMASRPTARLAQLPWLDDQGQLELLRTWSRGEQLAYDAACVHELVEAAAHRTPEAIALVGDDKSLCYAELDRRASRIAQGLRVVLERQASGRAERDNPRVAICLPRSVDFIIAILGVLKAGGAYVPLDPKFPADRLEHILTDSGASLVLADEERGPALREGGRVVLSLAALEGMDTSAGAGQAARGRQRPEQLAYMIYTSGSTGRPKGVAVEHRQLVHYVRGVLARLPDDIASMALVSTVAADLGHTSLFGALCSGRTLHVISDECTFDPNALAEMMRGQRIDALKIVPSHLDALLQAAQPEHVLPRRCLILGGETARPELIARVQSLAPSCTILNHYGPTETTVGALTHRLEATASSVLPLGRPLPNAHAYVVDDDLQQVAIGAAGELVLGGEGVTRGYHNRPALTAERFVPDPFSPVHGKRLYRTGDLARYRDDGTIEFLGRRDHQLKIRGHRIELGEIEACLREQAGVRDAVVVAREQGAAKRLVAYVVPQSGATLDARALSDQLALRLPDYMVPSALMTLPNLPLTRNGKIDRIALPDPSAPAATPATAAEGPRNEIEEHLVQIWSTVLGRAQVGIHDDFFALGGDSILSLQIIARASKKGLRITPKQLFASRTVAAVAAILAAAPKSAAAPAAKLPTLEPFALSRLKETELARLQQKHGTALEDLYPAAPVQQGMLFHALLTPDANPYFNQIVCRVSSDIDATAFAAAFQTLSQRHAMLRTGFVLDGVDEPHQVVLRAVELPLAQLDWRAVPEAARDQALARFLEQDRARGFQFERPPLMRVTLIQLGPQLVELVWSVHHAVIDGFCQGRLVQEWLELYEAARTGVARWPTRTAVPVASYRDYVAWLARQDKDAARAFFRTYLEGFTTPLALPAPRGTSTGPFDIRELRAALPEDLTAATSALCVRHGITLNTLVQGVWGLLLSRFAGTSDVVFGVTVAGRPSDLPGAETILGAFINSLPLRLRIDPSAQLGTWLAQIQALNLELRQYEFLPLVEVQGVSQVSSSAALFDTLLVFQNFPLDDAQEQQREALGMDVTLQDAWTHYPLTLYAVPGTQLSFQLAYDARRIEPAVVAELAVNLPALIRTLTEHESASLAKLLDESPPASTTRILRGEARASYGQQTLVELLARQMALTPDATALVAGEQKFSYSALNRRANQLAHHLQRRGVRPEARVGLCTTRSADMLVGLLGILKTGAAYVPLDPSYPPERLRYMLEDAGVRLVVTQQAPSRVLGAEHITCVYLDDEALAIAAESTDEVVPPGHPDALAYVIYTSGSTGRPKGVMVRHGGVTNFLRAMQDQLAFDAQTVVLATTSLSFDIAVLELLLPLVVGGKVVLAAREDATDGERLNALLASSGASCLQATPTGWKTLFSHARPRLDDVAVLCGGEALTPDLVASMRAAGGKPWNLYGPTETTVWSMLHRAADEREFIPLGRPLANTSIYLLDAQLRPVPIGVPGELCVGGKGLARGYLGQPALTATRFVPDPFSTEPGQRVYRTGDLARLHPDGRLEFLGRSDHQCKLRGFRIELGEIEACLRTTPGVADALVCVRADAAEPALVAYLIPQRSLLPQLEADALRRQLKQRLPDYMVPSSYVLLDAFPTTPNGKVDRSALPAPTARSREVHAAPRTATEEIIAAIWAEILGLEHVGVEENFFELGGHSLLATRAMSRLRAAFSLPLPLRTMFDQPTVSRLAAAIEAARTRDDDAPRLPPLTPRPQRERYPLSFAQQRLWFLEQLEGERGLFTLPFARRLKGPIDAELLRQSCEALVARHEVLRTAIIGDSGEVHQQVFPPSRFELPVRDLSGLARGELERACADQHEAFLAARFDLARPPLLRVALLRLAADEHVLLVALHHIVADGWSLALLADQLVANYRTLRGGGALATAQPALQYIDYASWQRGLPSDLWAAQLHYWRAQLVGRPVRLRLLGARDGDSGERRAARRTQSIPPKLTTALKQHADANDVTVFMLLYTALNVLLHQQTGLNDFVVGTDVANRHVAETEAMVGFFVNQLALRCRLDGTLPLADLLIQCRRVALDAYQHQDLPFDRLVAEELTERDAASGSLFQVKLVLQNTPPAGLALEDGLVVSEIELPVRDAELDLLLNASLDDDGLQIVYEYRADLYPAAVVERFSVLYAFTLQALGEQRAASVSELCELIGQHERASARQAQRGDTERARPTLAGATRKLAAVKGT